MSLASIDVVTIHVIGLCHAGRLTVGPTEWLGFRRRNWFVDTCLGGRGRQWLVVRVPREEKYLALTMHDL